MQSKTFERSYRRCRVLTAMEAAAITAAVMLLAAAGPREAMAGGVKGKVEATKEFNEYLDKSLNEFLKEKEDYYWLIENGVLPIQPPSLDWTSEILVTVMNPSSAPSTGGIETVDIKGAAMKPGVIVISPKTTVKFKNEDPFIHSLYSPELGHSFDPEILTSRQLRQVQFLNPGVYTIRCKMTPHLEGIVIVDPAVMTYKTLAADMTFLIENLPPGKYQIKVYYKSNEIGSQDVEIVDEKPVEVLIKLSPPGKAKAAGEAKEGTEAKPEEKKEGTEGAAEEGTGKGAKGKKGKK